MPSLPAVRLEIGDGLTASPLRAQDAVAVTEALQDAELRRWLPVPNPYTVADARAWCETTTERARRDGAGLTLGIRRDTRLAGCLEIKRVDWRARSAEISYWTAPDDRGRGFMARAVERVTSWMLKEMAFERVELRIAPDNTGSLRVAERAGFVREGTARNAGFTPSGRVDLVIYSRIPTDAAR